MDISPSPTLQRCIDGVWRTGDVEAGPAAASAKL